MAVVRRVVNLGRGLRKREQLRVRQPLSKLTVVTRNGGSQSAVESHVALIGEELNVKEVAVESDESQLVHLAAKANFKALGPRLGSRTKEIAQSIAALEHDTVAQLLDGTAIDVAGEEITADDVVVERTPRAGIVVAADDDMTIVLDTALSTELIHEGLARELINRVQGMRRELGLDVSDRITLGVTTEDPELAATLESHSELIATETLASEIIAAAGSASEFDIAGHSARIEVERAAGG